VESVIEARGGHARIKTNEPHKGRDLYGSGTNAPLSEEKVPEEKVSLFKMGGALTPPSKGKRVGWEAGCSQTEGGTR